LESLQGVEKKSPKHTERSTRARSSDLLGLEKHSKNESSSAEGQQETVGPSTEKVHLCEVRYCSSICPHLSVDQDRIQRNSDGHRRLPKASSLYPVRGGRQNMFPENRQGAAARSGKRLHGCCSRRRMQCALQYPRNKLRGGQVRKKNGQQIDSLGFVCLLAEAQRDTSRQKR